jgi:hypothetical protein
MGMELIQAFNLEEAILGIGKMIFNMERVLKNGKMKATMKENFNMERKVELVNRNGQMVLFTVVIGKII